MGCIWRLRATTRIAREKKIIFMEKDEDIGIIGRWSNERKILYDLIKTV